jgi:hypothetical protein
MKRTILTAALLVAIAPTYAEAQSTTITFPLTVSKGAATCSGFISKEPSGTVTDHSFGQFENLEVVVEHLPPNTDFDLFSIEVPNAPFGLAWYIGDIDTDATGVGVGNFVGRFNIETFVVSVGVPALPLGEPPQVFNPPSAVIPEATIGVQTNPVQLYHLGLWFNSPADAAKAGCPSTKTPFNGEHNAGIQVLNTATFPENAGPLIHLK